MKAQNCPKLNECLKIRGILDKDAFDFQFVKAIEVVCEKCEEQKSG